MTWSETLVAFAAIAVVFFLIYTNAKGQSLLDTVNEIKEIFNENLMEKPQEVMRYA